MLGAERSIARAPTHSALVAVKCKKGRDTTTVELIAKDLTIAIAKFRVVLSPLRLKASLGVGRSPGQAGDVFDWARLTYGTRSRSGFGVQDIFVSWLSGMSRTSRGMSVQAGGDFTGIRDDASSEIRDAMIVMAVSAAIGSFMSQVLVYSVGSKGWS
ncbi:hypothetical protein FIBSPDRAFT_882185 [Athelia psychrophila]|uniref:Uncharacterized protein n=1 Tax=Athelia psychrophila TaxID=1759441 RepID=A0A166VM04_9AGAM|nr:hypothetical protein FIBSPDRAFT_882185 [Fibularhizoctonia sp. CBS 109695]